MKSILTLAAALVLLAGVSFAKDKDHSADYQVGVFLATGHASGGAVSQRTSGGIFGGGAVSTREIGHNVAIFQTPTGIYRIEPPISIAASILMGGKIDPHKGWFVDQLHAGDKLLFAAKCNKHNNCTFWVPNPDKPGKEFESLGSYEPTIAKTNTNQLCGTGKLAPAVEAEVCAPAAPPAAEPTSEPPAAPEAAPAPVTPPPQSAQVDPRMEQYKRMCASGVIKDPTGKKLCEATFPKQ